jgi:serine phosphatase RsbU (regulator of sigma subunit)/integral membrane sensor domain MASE1/anti-sigma regulatory factor (Ser/Thr protein kinase)
MSLGLRPSTKRQTGASGRAPRPTLVDGTQVLLAAAAYYLAAKFSLRLALIESNVTPLWPPTGIAVVAFLVLRRKAWLGIFFAALLVNAPISSHFLGASVTAAGNTLAPFVGATLLQRVGFHWQIDRLRDAIAIVLAALFSMTISASVGTATLVVEGTIPASHFLSAWAVWWTGDTMGVLVVAPFLLNIRGYGRLRGWGRRAELGALLAVIAVVALAVMRSDLQIMFLALPLLGFAAWRFQQLGAAPGALLVAGIATWTAAHSMGPFQTGTLAQKMLTLQAFNATVAFTSFIFAAVLSERARAREALERAASELETRVQQRTAELFATNERMQREHHIAETLQRSLLPSQLPDIPGILLAARYVPGTQGIQIGGDWYDVVQLPDGQVGLSVGDVVGHGLPAASAMGQLRMALRAYALRDPSPAEVIRKLHLLVEGQGLTEMATVVYLVFDPISGTIRYANAGHPPPLVVRKDGRAVYLEAALAPPLGPLAHFDDYVEAEAEFPLGSTLVLYTDGLVERRGASLSTGLDRLRAEVEGARHRDVEELCDHLLGSLLGPEVSDDVAILCVRHAPITEEPLRLSFLAEPHVLAPLRTTVRRWLSETGAETQESYDILVACGEACTNAIQHAYGAGEGSVEVELALVRRVVEVTIRDSGGWRPPSGGEWGRGLGLMRGLMDTVEIDHDADGTTVRMRRQLHAEAPS